MVRLGKVGSGKVVLSWQGNAWLGVWHGTARIVLGTMIKYLTACLFVE